MKKRRTSIWDTRSIWIEKCAFIVKGGDMKKKIKEESLSWNVIAHTNLGESGIHTSQDTWNRTWERQKRPNVRAWGSIWKETSSQRRKQITLSLMMTTVVIYLKRFGSGRDGVQDVTTQEPSTEGVMGAMEDHTLA